MTKYTLTGYQTISTTVEANSPGDAIKKLRDRRPNAQIEYVDDNCVMGLCEVCQEPLYDDTDYCHDEDIVWCRSHGEEL